MASSRIFFICFAVLIALTGLAAASWAEDYLHAFGLGLAAFGSLFAFGCVKRHFDEQEGARLVFAKAASARGRGVAPDAAD